MRPASHLFAVSVVAGAVALAGCQSRPAVPVRPASVAPAIRTAVIVSARPVVAPAGADIRRSILGALGTPPVGAPTRSGETEFIVRQDGGQTLSVVQAGDASLRPGVRVELRNGAQTRLALLAGN